MVDAEGHDRPVLLVFSDDWGRHPSSCQHLISSLLGDYRVVWVNTIGTRRPGLDRVTLRRGGEKIRSWFGRSPNETKTLPEGLTVVEPKMWPWFTRRHDRWLNRRLLLHKLCPIVNSISPPVLGVTTLPIVADLVGRLPVARWVYYCVDDFGAWPGLDQGVLRRMEEELVSKVDTIIAASETLQRHIAALGREASLLTHGVNLEHWKRNGASRPPVDLAKHPHPWIVFWGVVDRRLDVEFLAKLAADMTAGTILLVGPRENPDPALFRLDRVVHVPPLPYAELPRLAAAADVLVMPYRDLEVTRAMQPLKLKEYLATGKPTVVRDLPAVAPWSDCLDACRTADEFSHAVCRHLAKRSDAPACKIDDRLAGESWTAKARLFEELAIRDQ